MIDYVGLLERQASVGLEGAVAFLMDELPYEWRDEYLAMTPRQTNICRFTHDGFEFIFDNYGALEASGDAPRSDTIEDRLVAVHGLSRPHTQKREVSRIRGWIGATTRFLGADRDKGHFIGCSLGDGWTASRSICSRNSEP